ncbi:alpha/beta hydrolase [Macrococcoides bohemicum]|uniref:Alpha/beta hydrolase n=1 Tax=Macrococcoides bohemicum TaxID=1903056 RepID=A0AAJ4P921_9STAP|nr:alpha/beta hydrolase [Macrococcus bohemicus]QYA41314.1 alpha/beta hydrolase [Macrococcus bohemicus]
MKNLNRLLKENHLDYKTVETGNGKISYFETDNKNNKFETLLLLHGFGANGLDYLPIIKILKDRYHIISLDLPERGESKLISNNDFTPESIAKWLYSFINKIQIDNFHLVCHSIAAHYGLYYASKYSLETLILLDGGYLVPKYFDGYSLEKEINDTRSLIQTLSYNSEQELFESLITQGNTFEKNIIDRRLFIEEDGKLVFTLSEEVSVQMTLDVANYPDYDLIRTIDKDIYMIRSDKPEEINDIREKCINQFIKAKEISITILKDSNHSLYHDKAPEVSILIDNWIKQNSHR